MASQRSNERNRKRGKHALLVARLLVAATLLLIVVGGLVTTYQAGMAVPDWPNTYGYNLFLYPWQTWIAGPWDLFVEHGHRLLGAAVGLLTITLVVLVQRSGASPAIRRLTWLALGLVIFQGTLGGARVRLDRQLLALLHGCTAPIVLVTVAAIATCLASPAASADHIASRETDGTCKLARLGLLTAGLIYGQIVLGACIRHISPFASGDQFRIVVWFHLLLAGAIAGHIAVLTVCAHRNAISSRLRRRAWLLAVLLAFQISLGLLTWVAQFGYPSWLAQYHFAAAHTIEAEGLWQTTVTTLHVATGSALLAAAATLAIGASREAGSLPWSVGSLAAKRSNGLAWEGAR